VLSIRVLVALSETEVDDVHVVLACVVATDQEIVGLDVSVDDSLLMDFLDTLDLLNIIDYCVTIWMAMHRTVLRSNLRLHSWNRSSRLLPSKSITITW
jgi:hypothetical protein